MFLKETSPSKIAIEEILENPRKLSNSIIKSIEKTLFDKKNRTIKLSIKAKEEKEEREAIDEYQSDEKDSISKTSLGDLLKSKFSRKK